MTKKTLLVTQKSCGGCAAVKRALSEELRTGEIEEVPIETEKGEHIADLLDLDMVPECIEEEDGKFTRCDLDALLNKKKL